MEDQSLWMPPGPNDPKFSPSWLMIDISPDDKSRVQAWLVHNGVDLDSCAGFDYYPGAMLIRAKMYEKNESGSYVLEPDGKPKYGPDIEFSSVGCPPIVTSCRALHRL